MSSKANPFPKWTPPALVEWLAKCGDKWPPGKIALWKRLATDERMRPVWEWLRTEWERREARIHDYVASVTLPAGKTWVCGPSTNRFTPTGLCFDIEHAMFPRGKPGNMPPKERTVYLELVCKHACALYELLCDTRYDLSAILSMSPAIDPDELHRVLEQDLVPWGEDDEGHLVAYWVDKDGICRMPWNYPECALTSFLMDLMGWTYQDDYWGGMRSSKMLSHTTGRNARIMYFVRSIYDSVSQDGGIIPPPVIANMAEVALELPEALSEDTVRKQIQRYQAKKAKVETERDTNNSEETDDSF